MNLVKKIIAFIMILALMQIPYRGFTAKNLQNKAEEFMLVAEAEKTQKALNEAVLAVKELDDSENKWNLYKRADAVQTYISENVAGTCHYNFSTPGTVIITEKSEGNATSGYSAGGKVAEVDGEKVLRMIYGGFGGEGYGVGTPNIYKDINWPNSIDGIAKITMSFNIKSTSNPYYQMWFRYFSMLGATDMFNVSGQGVTCRNSGSDVIAFGEDDGFETGKWYDLTIFFNTTKNENAGISPMSYKLYVGERGQKQQQYGDEFVMQTPSTDGPGDYTCPPNSTNVRSRLRFTVGTKAKTTPGACEILVGSMDVCQFNDFTVTENSISYDEQNVNILLDKILLEMSEETDKDLTAIELSDTDGDLADISWEITGNKIDISVNEALKSNGSYTIVLSGITDIYGRTYQRMNIPFETQKAYLDIDITASPTALCENEKKDAVVYGILPEQNEFIDNSSVTISSDNSDIVLVENGTFAGNKRGIAALTYSFTNVEGKTYEKKASAIVYYNVVNHNNFDDVVSEGNEIFSGEGSLAVLDGETRTLATLKDGDVSEFWFFPKNGAELKLKAGQKEYAVNGNSDCWNQVVVANYGSSNKIYVNGIETLDFECINNENLDASIFGGNVYIDSLSVYNCFESKPYAHSVSITGTAKKGSVLYGGYLYGADDGAKEENSEFGWIIDGSTHAKGEKSLAVAANMEGRIVAFYVVVQNEYGIKGKTVISDSVKIAVTQPISYTGGGGGGGGRGSSGGSSYSSPVTNVVETPKTDVDNKVSVFYDTNGHWAEETIKFMTDSGLIKGYNDGKFLPDNSITRAEFTALVLRIMSKLGITKQEIGEVKSFDDVKPEMWFYNDICRAYKYGLIKGNGEKMNPDNPITRQEMAVILASVVDKEGTETTEFSDFGEIDSWAKEAVNKLSKLGLMQGDNGFFRPKNNATRAETATVLKKLMDINE